MIDQPSDHQLSIGSIAPVVGILSTVRRSYNKYFPVGNEARILIEKFAMAKQYGLIMFLFYPDDVSWENMTIRGYTLSSDKDKKGPWVRRTFPFPDVVYNRIRNRNIEKQPRVKQLLKRFDNNPNTQLINKRFFDKWEVNKALLNDPDTLAMVPQTSLLSARNLKRYLDKYSIVFIKPRDNNAARGIIKVIRETSNIYNYCQAESSPPDWKKCISFSDLWNQLSILIKKPDNYLVQTGINLCRLDGRIFDLRAQIQKDGNGQWVFTGIEVRVAARTRFVTTGFIYGKRMSFDKVINIVSGGSEAFKSRVNSQLSYLYKYVPRVLEKDLGLSLAVLSIDIGLDVHGKIWVIEVSSKPEPFVKSNVRARHFRYLVEYFIYITRNNPNNNSHV
jgi:hypothetical protein